MKYVVFKSGDLLMPVIVPDHVTHSQVQIEGAAPVSAGFVEISSSRGVVVESRPSESLGLLGNFGMYAFYDP